MFGTLSARAEAANNFEAQSTGYQLHEGSLPASVEPHVPHYVDAYRFRSEPHRSNMAV